MQSTALKSVALNTAGASEPPFLYLAWQDVSSRRWFAVGSLELKEGTYRFSYTQGFRTAQQEAGLSAIPGFPEQDRLYQSEELFPLFQNRIMSPSREDYSEYLEKLNLSNQPGLPMYILARSAGKRSTDSFEVFPRPLRETEDGRFFSAEFFSHGLRHSTESAQKKALELQEGDQLFLMSDFQNPEDPQALALRTDDRHVLGYMPRYFCADLLALAKQGVSISVKVLKVNPPPTPAQQRILCQVEAAWPFAELPLSQEEYRSLAQSAGD